MNQKPGGWHCLCGLVLLCAMLSACGNESSDQKGRNMFLGLFGSKDAVKAGTVVAAELRGTWQAESVVPAKFPPAFVSSWPECKMVYFRGAPPDATWADEFVAGETRRAFLVPVSATQPPLAILSYLNEQKRLQVWELSNDKAARFVKHRQVTLAAAQATWGADFPVDVFCLPGPMVALAVGYQAPQAKLALFTYDRANNHFRMIDVISPEMSMPPPFKSFETLAATQEAMLLLYHTGVIRLGAGNFVYEHDHVLLFSKKHPQGLKILKLSIKDGNIRSWAMQGTKLWLQTEDRRKNVSNFNWSLDLNSVL